MIATVEEIVVDSCSCSCKNSKDSKDSKYSKDRKDSIDNIYGNIIDRDEDINSYDGHNDGSDSVTDGRYVDDSDFMDDDGDHTSGDTNTMMRGRWVGTMDLLDH